MGLLDSLFSGGESGGGLLDFLRNNAMNQQFGGPLQSDQAQYGAPMGAMEQAPQQALMQPQMPQLAPRPAAPPQPMQAAAPAAPQPQAPAPQPEALPPAFGGTSYLERLNAGGGLIGSMLGDSTQQRNLTAQYHALRKVAEANGDSQEVASSKAMMAVMNPKAAETLMPELFSTKADFGVVRKDQFDRDIFGFRDPRKRKVEEYNPSGPQPEAPSAIPAAPPGVDPKIWRNKQSERSVQDAMPASFDDTSKLRTELSKLPSYQNISQAAPIYKSMHDAAGRNTKAADLNMVYGLGKIMDPGSVVREGEIHMANNAQGWQEKLNGIIAQIQNEGGLTPAGRQALMAEAHSRMQSYKQMYDQDAERYRGIAKRNKANPDDVVHDFGEFQPWTAKSSAPVTIDGYTIKAR